MNAGIAVAATDDAAGRKHAMARDLEDSWLRFTEAVSLEPETLKLMQKAYWYGVTTGVAVFCKAMDGAYK